MRHPGMMQRLWQDFNGTSSMIYMGFGTAVAAMEWRVGGTPWSGILLALKVDLTSIITLQVALMVLGLTAKSRNPVTSGRSYGDAINVSRWLRSMYIATCATMLGLAPVALLCYLRTGGPCALFSTFCALIVGGTMLLAWVGNTAVHDLASEKYERYRLR